MYILSNKLYADIVQTNISLIFGASQLPDLLFYPVVFNVLFFFL